MLIVYDSSVDAFLDSHLLDPTFTVQYPGLSMWTKLHDQLQQNGWEMVSADRFLETPRYDQKALLVSDMLSARTQALIDMGVEPCVCLSGESPNVAWKFYKEVVRDRYGFQKYYLFRGMSKFMGQGVDVSPFYWPNSEQEIDAGLAWKKRKLLVMIASNKRRYSTIRNSKVLEICKWTYWQTLRYTNPLFRFGDLYQRRLDAIQYFSSCKGFDLLGWGWRDQKTLTKREYQAVQQCYCGELDSKHDALKRYKFAICFENCVFAGYVTEKIFDCFLSGCIPVYMGAPDIADFIPEDSYVDFRAFKGFAELEHYLETMSCIESQAFLSAAEVFLASAECRKFSDVFLASSIVGDIEYYIEKVA